MGYVRDTVYVLHFEDPGLQGLEVRMRSLSVLEYLDLESLRSEKIDDADLRRGRLVEVFERFADRIVSWNLETRDQAGEVTELPVSRESVLAQDFDFTNAMVSAWMAAVGGIEIPLGDASTGGRPSVEARIPMETLPESQAS